MHVNHMTDEFQSVFRRYKRFNKNKKMNIHELLQERARQTLANKTEEDFIIEDLMKAKNRSGLPIHQVIKMEEIHKRQVELQKFRKENVLEMFKTEQTEHNVFDDINKQLDEINIYQPVSTLSVNRKKSLFGLKHEDFLLLNDSLSPKLKKSFGQAILKTKQSNVLKKIKDTVSTRVLTEDDDFFKHIENGCSRRLRKVIDKHKKIKNFVENIEKYEKVLEKTRDYSLKKLDEYEKKKNLLRKQYKHVYDENFTTFL
jgi:hypothetical protein